MGRPRKDGERYPSGKLKPPTQDARVAPALIHRIRDNAGAAGIDRRFGSEVGRLLLIEQLNALEAGAAWRMAEVYGRFDRWHALTRRTIKSPDYEGRRSSSPVRLSQNESAIAAHEAFIALQDHLDRWPPRYRRALESLCVDDINVGSLMTAELRPILRWMAGKHFKTKGNDETHQHRGGSRDRSSNFARDTEQLVESAQAESTPAPAPQSDRVSEMRTMVRDYARALIERERFRKAKTSEPVET